MFEQLENRQMFAAALANGALTVTGTENNDSIVVAKRPNNLLRVVTNSVVQQFNLSQVSKVVVNARSGNDVVRINSNVTLPVTINGGAGNDELHAGGGATEINGSSGSDFIYGGLKNDKLNGESGVDTIVSLGGGTSDKLSGGSSTDVFWRDKTSGETISDKSSTESSLKTDHRVAKFADARIATGAFSSTTATISSELNGQNLPDPVMQADPDSGEMPVYENFSTHRLFASDGPKLTDINQGRLGDCYYLAVLGSIAKTTPAFLTRHAVDLGDGTYAVRFSRGGTETFVRVDGELPVFDSNGSLAYQNFGHDGSIWAAVYEKAYAFFRHNEGTYGSIEGGFAGSPVPVLMEGAFHDLGITSTTKFPIPFLQDQVLGELRAAVNSGKAVTAATSPLILDGTKVFKSHQYVVNNFFVNSAGKITSVKLYNPHGVDFGGESTGDSDAFDGFVTISANRFYSNFISFDVASVS
jgi:hypothetical protein